MTLPTSTRVTDPYETDGVQRDFEFDFPAFYNADTGHYGIEVRRLTALDYEVIDKSLYDIFLNDEDKSGYVRFHVAPMAGDGIYIAGDTTRSQQLNLINYGRYSAQSIEKAFDLIVALIQEFVSKVDEETRQRILADQALRDFLLIKFNQFTAEVTTKIDKHIGDINGFMSSLIPMFVCIMRKEIANYAETGMQDVIDEKLSDLSTQVANALDVLDESVSRINAATTATAIAARLFDTPAAGVNPVTGVPAGSYFNVRSPNADSYVDEYQNVGGVATATGKSYPSASYINDLIRKKQPSFYGAKGDGVTVDNAAFSALMATKPDTIMADPNATYLLDSSSTVTVGDSLVFNGNGCTVIMDQRWNIQKTPMWGSQLTEAAVKGQTVLKMAFMTNWAVGDEVLVFQNLGLSGAAIDPYFLSVADDVDNGEYSSHVNYVTAVDTVNKTITLATPLEFNAPIQTSIYKISNKKIVFKDVNFIIKGNASGFRLLDNCDYIEFDNCSFVNGNAVPDNMSIRINTCYRVLFKMCRTVGVNISVEYGSYLCGQVGLRGSSYGFGDAVFMIWCAATNCFSVKGTFTPSNTMNAGSISAGVYLGAKTRNCISIDDYVDGLPYGFRAQWGAVNPKFTRCTADNIKTYSLFSDYSHNVQVIDCTLYDKPLRTVGVHQLTLRGTLLDSKWRGGAGELPLMLDLNRGNDTVMVRENYTIEGNTVVGLARAWVALKNSRIVGNTMTAFRCANGGLHEHLVIDGNTFGNFYTQNMVGSFVNNTIDHSMLQSSTVAGSDVAGVHFYAQTVVNMSGNTIKHPTCGVKRTTPISHVNRITDSGGNNIIAPTQWDTGVDDTTAPTISTGAAYLSRGLEYKSNVAGSKVVWRYNGSAWVKGFTSNPQLTYTQGSFPNTPNGLTTFVTTRTIAGAEIGDTILVSTNSADIGEAKGKYLARVTSPNTVTVYYQDRSGVQETVPSLNITLTLIKN